MTAAESTQRPPATDAPAVIGALAATYAAIELGKLIAGELDDALIGRELYIDARHHQQTVTRWTRNPNCRFDHLAREAAALEPGSLRETLARVGGGNAGAELSVEGDLFVGAPACRACGATTPLFKLQSRVSASEMCCAECGVPLTPAGFDLLDVLSAAAVPPELLDAPLSRFGLRPRDILSLEGAGGVEHFELTAPGAPVVRDGAEVILAGCGNIGSHLVAQLARLPGLRRVVLIDPDVYEAKNFSGQDIHPSDFGRAKVTVQAERLAALAPSLEIETCREPLEAVPMGRFRGSIAVGALDSRRARMDLNLRAHRVGIPWIDTAVHGAMMLCRIGVYVAGHDTPCIECGWSEDDYARLEQRLPCVHAAEVSVDRP